LSAQHRRGSPRGEPKTMAVRDAVTRPGGKVRPVRVIRPSGKSTAGGTRRAALQQKRRGRLIITTNLQARRRRRCSNVSNWRDRNPWNRSGTAAQEADAVQHAEAVKRKYQGPDQANIKQEQNPREPQHGCRASAARRRGRRLQIAADSALVYFGAASAAGAFALGAAFFLPLVGATGSSCA